MVTGLIRSALFIVAAVFAAPLTTPVAAQDLPEYQSIYVNDFADVLSQETEAELSAMLAQARADRNHEMTVVTINSRDEYGSFPDIAAFGQALFNAWGVGDKDSNDGIMLIVAVEDRELRIALGGGYAARYDAIAARIIDQVIIPEFAEGRLERGLLLGTDASLQRLRIAATAPAPVPVPVPVPDPVPAPVPRVETVHPEAQAPAQDFMRPNLFFRIRDWIYEAFIYNPVLAAIIATLCSVAGFFGIRWGSRNRPRKCPECGRVMLRLGDKQEDQYLDHGQLVEEKIDSKDYGVWFCTHDEHVTIIGYPALFSRHKACPDCGYHTYETRRQVIRAATTTAQGTAKLHHTCRNCGHKATSTVTIPRISQSKTSGGRSRSFFSSSGRRRSGFGGGRSRGGGASGRW